jgi:hypothetical protein
MEKIMNKSSKDNASSLGHSTFEDRTLDDAELTAVTGGGGKSTGKSTGVSEITHAVLRASQIHIQGTTMTRWRRWLRVST